MKKILLFILTITSSLPTLACPVCERNQPKLVKGIIHGSGPDSNWDYVIVAITSIITLATLFYSIKWIIKPGEKNKDHIKHSILK
jgi:phage shock protein PspC (stress-responsive transcriptional regulator)